MKSVWFGSQVVVLAALALSLVGLAQDKPKTHRNDPELVQKIRGDYVLKGGSVNGVALTADRIANVSAKITDQTITTYDGQLQQRFGVGYQLFADIRPWQVDLKSVKKVTSSDGNESREKVEQAEGIIELSDDGQRLRLAYATEGGRPKDFKAAKNHNVFEFERLKRK